MDLVRELNGCLHSYSTTDQNEGVFTRVIRILIRNAHFELKFERRYSLDRVYAKITSRCVIWDARFKNNDDSKDGILDRVYIRQITSRVVI